MRVDEGSIALGSFHCRYRTCTEPLYAILFQVILFALSLIDLSYVDILLLLAVPVRLLVLIIG